MVATKGTKTKAAVLGRATATCPTSEEKSNQLASRATSEGLLGSAGMPTANVARQGGIDGAVTAMP